MAEYISREDVLKKAKSSISVPADNEWDCGYNTAMAEMQEFIKHLTAADVQPVDIWISVDERLPEADYDCFVWYSCDTAFGKCKSWGIAHCSRCDWYTKHLDGDNIVVLYWMPCPEPPKDGDAE